MDAPSDLSFGGVGKVLIADGESGDTGLVVFLLVLVVFGSGDQAWMGWELPSM